jgi:hydroxypyruvate reductase
MRGAARRRARFFQARVRLSGLFHQAEASISTQPNDAASAARPAILAVTAKTWPPQLLAMLREHYDVLELPIAAIDRFESIVGRAAQRIRAIVTQTAPGAPGRLIAALPNLEAVFVSGAHVDNVDLAACRARAIPVTHTPGLSVNDVADFVVTHLLGIARRLAEADRFVRAGKWPDGILPLSRRVTGKAVGIVGLGKIGGAVARRLSAFDMKVGYFGPRQKSGVPYTYYDDLLAMARDVDFMVVTCVSGPATRHMIGRPVFEALGPEAFFINVTRGVVVDRDLIAALQNGTLGGAGIDVYETSPHVPAELMQLDSVVLSPHVAGFTHELTQSHTDLVLANMRAHFSGEPLLSPVVGDGH